MKKFYDRRTQHNNRYKLTDLGDGVVQLDKLEGDVYQNGTKINAANLNDIFEEIYSLVQAGYTTEQLLAAIQSKIDDGSMAALTIGEKSIITSLLADNVVTYAKQGFMEVEGGTSNIYDGVQMVGGLNSDGTSFSSVNYGHTNFLELNKGKALSDFTIRITDTAKLVSNPYLFGYDTNSDTTGTQIAFTNEGDGVFIATVLDEYKYIRMLTKSTWGNIKDTLIIEITKNNKKVVINDYDLDDRYFKNENYLKDNDVTTEAIKDNSVNVNKVDFITVSDETEEISLHSLGNTSILPTGEFQTGQQTKFKTVTFSLEKNKNYKIVRGTITSRFRVALYSEEPINGTVGQLIIDDAALEKCTFNSIDYSYCSILYTSSSEDLNMTVTKLDENKSYVLDSRIQLPTVEKEEYKKYLSFIGLSDMTFSGTWAEVTNDLALLGVYKQSNTSNSTVSATFTGPQINIHYFSGGKVSINLDGNISILDTSSTETEEQIYVIDNLENKEHTLTISVLEGYFKIDYFTVIKESTELEVVVNKEEINKIDTDFKTKENIKTSSLKTKLLRATKSYLLRSGTTTLEDYKEILLNTTRKCILTYNLSSLEGKKINKAILKLTNSLNATKKNCTTDSNKFYVGYLKVSPETLTYDTLDETNNVEYLDESIVYWIEAWYSCSTIDITNTIRAMLQNNGYGIVLKWECLDSDGNAITNTLVYNDNDMSNSLYIEYSEDNEYPCESVNNIVQNGITELLNNNFNNKYDWSYTGPYECLLMLYEEYGITEALAVLETYFNHYISDDGTNNSCTDLYKAELSRILLKLYKITGKSKYLTTVTNTLSLYSTAKNGIYLVNGGAITELSYFGMPFLLEYAEYFNKSKYVDIAVNQLLNLYSLISKDQADKVLLTVYKHDFSKGWSRGLGWFITGLAKCLTYNSIKEHKMYSTLIAMYKDVCETLLKYQQDSGLWKAIIHLDDSFEETSGTSLFVTAFEIGLREGLLDSRFTISKYKAIESLSKKMMGGVNLEDVFQFNGKNNHIYCLEKNTSDIGWSLAIEGLLNVYK